MPAWASSSEGVPEVGIARTASVTIRGRELLSANTSSTASPIPAFGVVVLDGDDRARRLGRVDQGLLVDRLDRVEVDHARPHLLVRERASEPF
jgi:hypothetical protein